MTDYYVEEEYEGAFEEEAGFYYPDDEPHDDRRLRSREIEGRTTWMYLGFLLGLFLVLVLFSWACDGGTTTPTDLIQNEGESTDSPVGVATRLSVNVSRDIVTVSGSVPDEAAREQILAATRQHYGPENVIDELIVDDGTTMDGGTVSITGSAEVGDARPEAIQASLVGLGLDAGEFTVDRGSAQVDPVELQAVLDGTSVTFTGTVPDEASLTDLIAAGEAVWGPGSVDVSGVGVGAASWAEARVTLTGVTGPGDQRYEAFPAEIRNRFGNLVEVDVSEVEVDTGSEALAAIETAIADALAAQPITFAPVSADIDSESDEVLSTIAEELMAVPGVAVEVVGHTDDQGDEAENLALSQQRAEAVVARLVELGVDGARLTSRGEGEASPVADNDTAAGRAQNRRIEFLLGGAAN